MTGELPPRIVLLVSGLDRILSVTDGTVSYLLPQLQVLMSEGLGVRFQVVLAGLPKVVMHRVGMNVEGRIVMQLADPTEYGGVGAHRSMESQVRVPRRAVLLPDKRIMQLAQLAPAGEGEGAVIRLLAEKLPKPTVRPPHRFADIVWPMPWEQAMRSERTPPPQFLAPLPTSLDTDTGDWAWIDAADDGPVFAVVGPPKSGRSTAMAVMGVLASEQGWTVVNATTSRRSPLSTTSEPVLANRCDPDELGDVMESTSGRVLVLIDDLQRVEKADGIEAALGHRDRMLMVVASSPDFLTGRAGVMRSLPPMTAGMLLNPTGGLDGGAIGLRRIPQEWTSDSRAGRGILAVAGEPSHIQVPTYRL